VRVGPTSSAGTMVGGVSSAGSTGGGGGGGGYDAAPDPLGGG
jgi:hypothetical protein